LVTLKVDHSLVTWQNLLCQQAAKIGQIADMKKYLTGSSSDWVVM